MSRNRAALHFVVVISIIAGLLGCAGITPNRTPEKWLSLSYSGLAAMDQYTFTGSMSMGMEEGVMFKPQMFEGKVVNHHQLTIQSDQQDPLYWNPVEVLEALNKSHDTIEIIQDGERDASGVQSLLLRVQEKPNSSKEKWVNALSKGLKQLSGETIIGSKQSEHKRKELLEDAARELEGMLDTLKVQTEYDILIDKKKMIPLKMEERTLFYYTRDRRSVKENRHTTVRLQSFDGSTAKPNEVQ